MILNAPNLRITRKKALEVFGEEGLSTDGRSLNYDYLGKCLVQRQVSKYFPNLGYCLAWNHEDSEGNEETLYSLRKSDYISPYSVKRLTFENSCQRKHLASRWGYDAELWQLVGRGSGVEIEGYDTTAAVMGFYAAGTGAQVVNTELNSFKKDVPSLTKDEEYVLRIKIPATALDGFSVDNE